MHEPLFSYRNALSPSRLSNVIAIVNRLLNPLPVALAKLLISFKITTGNKLLAMNQGLSQWRVLYLNVAPVLTRRRMLHHTIPDHIQIDVDQATKKMLACLYRSCMIPIFLKCPLALFPSVERLGRFPCDQLQTLRDHLSPPINYQ